MDSGSPIIKRLGSEEGRRGLLGTKGKKGCVAEPQHVSAGGGVPLCHSEVPQRRARPER